MNAALMERDRRASDIPVKVRQAGSLMPLINTTAILTSFQSVLAMLNEESPWNFWAIMALFGYLTFLFQLTKYAPATIVIVMPFLLISTTEIASCVAIESGAWMDEISQAGIPTGGTARLAITLMAFFTVNALIIEPAWNRLQESSHGKPSESGSFNATPPITITSITTLLCLFHNVYLTSVGLRRGFPLFSGTDRFRYRLDLADPLFILLIQSPAIFATALAFLVSARSTRYLAVVLFSMLLLIQILFGEKFTMLIIPVAIFAAAGLLGYLAQYKRLPTVTLALTGIVVSLITMGTCLNYYTAISGSFDAAQTMLLERMAEQGEMWFVGDRDFRFNTDFNWPIIRDEIAACIGLRSTDLKVIGTSFGPMLVIEQYGNKDSLDAALEGSSWYVFTQTPYFLMISGYFGLTIVLLLISIAYAIAGRLLMIALINRNFVAALLAQKAMVSIYMSICTGWTFLALGYKTIGLMCAVWFLLHWRSLLKSFWSQGGPNNKAAILCESE